MTTGTPSFRWRNSRSSLHIWRTDTLVNLLWTPVISSCPTRWWERTTSTFPSPESTCHTFPVYLSTLESHIQHVNYRVSLYKWADQPVRGATGVNEDWPESPETTVIMWSCQPRWLIAWMLSIGKQMTRLIMKNTMKIMSSTISMKVMSDEWMVGLDPSSCCPVLTVL